MAPARAMPARPPIRTPEELRSAPPQLIARHMAWELRRAMAKTGITNLDLATDLHYKSAGNVSRWLNGHDPISHEGALRLDAKYQDWTLFLTEETFSSLYTKMRSATGVIPTREVHYDVFLASPMESVRGDRDEGRYPAERSAARDMVAALMTHCGFTRVFYAGHAIEQSADWEAPDTSLEGNVDAIRSADYFVLLAITAPPRPSGIYVEAGLALALGKPSVYFVGSDTVLPWMLRSADSHQSPHLPRVGIHTVEGMEQALGRVRTENIRMFRRLDDS